MAPSFDFYTLLRIPQDASPNDIKIAYHHTLLQLHPDKRSQLRHHGVVPANTIRGSPLLDDSASVDVALLKEAYRTLSYPCLRVEYDRSLRREGNSRSSGPRPAQVVSLEEFTQVTKDVETGSDTGLGIEEEAQEWWHRCRCGGTYRVTHDDLENDRHLVGCESCSEVIWVGYEEAPMTEDKEET